MTPDSQSPDVGVGVVDGGEAAVGVDGEVLGFF